MAYKDPKEHKGKKYTGMKVGGVHRWTYPEGEWNERKLEPSRWDFTFASDKRRRTKAPRGSGAEAGSEFHWYIMADQWVRKVDANTYATFMGGTKRLVGFKKPDWKSWNTQFRNQKDAKTRVKQALRDALDALELDGETPDDPWESENLLTLGTRGVDGSPVNDYVERLVKVSQEAA